MASSNLGQLAETLTKRMKVMVNNDLKKICKAEGMAQTGNKAALQGRISSRIDLAVQLSDHDLFNRLQQLISNPDSAASTSPSANYVARTPKTASPTVNGHNMANGHSGYSPYQQHQLTQQRPQVFYKESPFYEIRELVKGNMILEASPSHRQNYNGTLSLSDGICTRLRSDPSLRLLLFSALDQPLSAYTRLDITFPSQIEVRVNGGEVKANFKGLKNKPGSTRPADITDWIRITPANYRNALQITYALTQKKYNLTIYMARKSSVEDLTRRIKQRSVITKQSVLNDMMMKANDPDIVVGSSVMSLKDPISTLRITTPCRSTLCSHNQCFDAESFLQLQEQAPTWTCPICNKIITFEALAVDQYVQEILDSVGRDTDQVTIEPDGQWFRRSDDPAPKNNGYGGEDDSDDDLVEIPSLRISSIKTEAVSTPQSLMRTPPLPSREASSAPRAGSKRTSEVIDLTLSDDEEPRRPAKKVAYNTPNSLPDPSRRYQHHSFGAPSTPMRPQAHSYHSMSSNVRTDPPLPSRNPPSYQTYRQPPARLSYPAQGSSAYPSYLGSSSP